jgi:MFS family permease
LNRALRSTFGSYGQLLRIKEARGFLIAGFVGRYPISMRALAVLLLVLAAHDSYALAGAVSSTVTLTNAATAPMLGRLADRRRQGGVILGTLIVHATGIAGLLLLVQLGAPVWTLFVAAAVFGASALPLGSLVRARWAALLAGTPRVQTAFALEAFNDDIIYLSGPIIVTSITVAVSAKAAIVLVLVLVLAGWSALAVQRSSEPKPHLPSERRSQKVVAEPGMRALLSTTFVLGVWLGASNVALVAFAQEHGDPGFGGVLIGLTVFSGSVCGLTYGGITWKADLVQRLLWIALLLGLGSLPLLLANSLWLMALFALVAGMAITPMLVTMYSMLSNLVPKSSITEGFAWFASVITFGLSTGIAVSGYLVDYAESFGALLFLAGTGCAAPLLVVATRNLLGRKPFADSEPPSATKLVDTGTAEQSPATV